MPYYKIKRKATGSKATAWGWFAKYIKLRDCIATTGNPTIARCITCGEVKPWDDLDAGHMLLGRTGGILFDETMVHAQCRNCNRTGNGEYQMYKTVMIERRGQEWYELKEQAKKTNVKLGEFECKQYAEEYKAKYKALAALIA